ncbi:MFS transporter [Holdemania massiliensis]|uniref:MFS transporter n=1 Tax=Holdemania massiliensis TaxID=1468449 RepID=UPI0031F5BAD0
MRYKGSYLSYFFMYLFYYLSMALFSGLISVYLMNKGYSAGHVSLVTSSALIVSMVIQPFIGNLTDRFNKQKVSICLLLSGSVLGILFVHSQKIYWMAVFYSLALGCMNGCNPVIEKTATLARYSYASIRIWGSIGYATGIQVSGLIFQYLSGESVYYFFSLAILICAFGFLGVQKFDESDVKSSAELPYSLRDVFNKQYLIYLIIAVLFYGATTVHSTYLPVILQENGMSVNGAATVVSLGTLLELLVIFAGSKFINHIPNKTLLLIEFILLILQFATMAFIPWLPIKIVVILCTKSVATMAYIMINMKVIRTIVDVRYQMTALSIVMTAKNFVTIGFQVISSHLIDHGGSQLFYCFLFIVSCLAFGITLKSRMPKGDTVAMYH